MCRGNFIHKSIVYIWQPNFSILSFLCLSIQQYVDIANETSLAMKGYFYLLPHIYQLCFWNYKVLRTLCTRLCINKPVSSY
jgi:hypothetical protein